MKYLKTFERLEEYPFEIGDYVKIIDDDAMEWIKSGLYGKINSEIFKIIEISNNDNNTLHIYLLEEINDWFRRNQLEKATEEDFRKETQKKYNL